MVGMGLMLKQQEIEYLFAKLFCFNKNKGRMPYAPTTSLKRDRITTPLTRISIRFKANENIKFITTTAAKIKLKALNLLE